MCSSLTIVSSQLFAAVYLICFVLRDKTWKGRSDEKDFNVIITYFDNNLPNLTEWVVSFI